MTVNLILLIIIVIFLFYFKKKVTQLYKSFERKMDLAKDIMTHPQEIAAAMGGALVEKAIGKVGNLIKTKRGKK